MKTEFNLFFKRYEELLIMADTVFDRVGKEYPQCVKCGIGCSDCCNALFDLTLIEALYVNHHFNRQFEGREKEQLTERANRSDRDICKIKKQAYRDFEAGRKSENEILEALAEKRVRCPLLNDEEKCDLYEYRPVTCRFYGVPTSIGGQGHTCGISAFEKGEQYPTVNLDIVHRKLYEISAELVKSLKTGYVKMADMLVPLSMAMITEYDDTYLGVDEAKEGDDSNG
ncbi:MAG: hypothetical protein B6245_00985 [Desulfobacteraceae bacterium 4572_88]|nr:MAG: hypothetical protein B6245_00985 [Desulfobacteraceae bacterium 4572_88]